MFGLKLRWLQAPVRKGVGSRPTAVVPKSPPISSQGNVSRRNANRFGNDVDV